MKTKRMMGLFCLLTLLVCVGIGSLVVRPTRRGQESSFHEMLEYLSGISKEVHPSGTEENEEVRNYLRTFFNENGCIYEEMNFKRAAWPKVTGTKGVPFVNFLVTVDVPDSENGVLFISHYDSTPDGPGAADDGVSVAAELTAIKKCLEEKEKGNLHNDMYFLFTDGEECGLLGAQNFVITRQEMREKIKLVINMEARGNKGALVMFETSKNNSNLVKMLGRAVKRLDAYGGAAQIYRTMPNDTDLTCFLRSRYESCLNFATVDGAESYHQPIDTAENMNRDTAYMYYETIMQLVDYTKDHTLEELTATEDAVFFPFLFGGSVIISASSMKYAGYALSMLFVLWVLFLIIKKQLQIKEIGRAFLYPIVCLAAVAGFTAIYRAIFHTFAGTDRPLTDQMQLLSGMNIGLIIVVCLMITVITMIFHRFAKGQQEYLVIGMLLCAVGMNLLQVRFSCMVYIVFFPLFLLLLLSISKYYLEQKKIDDTVTTIFFFVIIGIITAALYYPAVKIVFDCFNNKYIVYYSLVEAFAVYLTTSCIVAAFPCAHK